MRPKTKLQKQVAALSRRLQGISEKQKQYALENCLPHRGVRTKNGIITCMDCGHSWQGHGPLVDTLIEGRCPKCRTDLKVETTRKQKYIEAEYFGIITVCRGFQVIRYFYVQGSYRKSQPANYFVSEVVQQWLSENGKNIAIAKLRNNSFYRDTWFFNSNLEIRNNYLCYNINPYCVYPRRYELPKAKWCNIPENFLALTPLEMYRVVLANKCTETLIKIGHTNIVRQFARDSYDKLDAVWPAIKTCQRNKYKIDDIIMWCDYIQLLHFFKKDLSNPYYACPADLQKEHDRFVKKKMEYDKKLKIERQLRERRKDDIIYEKEKKKYFDLLFTDGEIEICVLKNIRDFYEEGAALHHCIFSNKYYMKTYSLIFSARKNGERLETVEYSLSQKKVTQCHGLFNGSTDYHQRIIDLVNKNMARVDLSTGKYKKIIKGRSRKNSALLNNNHQIN